MSGCVQSAEDTHGAGRQETWRVSPWVFCNSHSLDHVVYRNGHRIGVPMHVSGPRHHDEIYLLKGI